MRCTFLKNLSTCIFSYICKLYISIPVSMPYLNFWKLLSVDASLAYCIHVPCVCSMLLRWLPSLANLSGPCCQSFPLLVFPPSFSNTLRLTKIANALPLQEASSAIPLFSPVLVPMAQSIGPLLSQITSSPTVRLGVRAYSPMTIM